MTKQNSRKKPIPPQKSTVVVAIDAFKTIALKAMNTGNFWLFCIGTVIAAFCWRLQSADLRDVVIAFINSGFFGVVGWILFFLYFGASILAFKLHHKTYSTELARVSEMRNELQSQAAGTTFASSKPPALPHNSEVQTP